MRKLFVPLVLLVLGGTAVFATIGLGDEGGNTPQAATAGRASESANVADTLHRVSTPGAKAGIAAVTAGKRKKPRIRYFETAPFSVGPGGAMSSELRCPRAGSRVLSGYFGSNSSQAVAETLSHPRGKRSWLEGVTDIVGSGDDTVFIGIVCALGVK
jgi:hypothetical protein